MRQQLICGNWKMNSSKAELASLIGALRKELDSAEGVDIAVAPPFPYLPLAQAALEGSKIKLGAQDVYWAASGAFTGEVSPWMLLDVGCEWVIVGHSERRQHFGETDKTVHQRAKAAFEAGLKPIVCVGETLQEREAEQTLAVVERQLRGALEGLTEEQLLKTVVAYEPVWAIGTGRVATPQQAQEVHAFMRQLIRQAGEAIPDSIRLLYGGSVNGANAGELLAQPDIDGALVGGASLKADEFIRIVKAARGARVAG